MLLPPCEAIVMFIQFLEHHIHLRILKCFLLFKNWFPSPLSWIQTPLKRVVSSNDAGFTKRELLAWRRCRSPTFQAQRPCLPPGRDANHRQS